MKHARHSLHISALLLGSTLVLGACTSGDPVYSTFSREAGSLLDGGSFGNATMNNTMVMSGERQYAHDLSQRFAREVMTTVNFAFNSARLDAGARDTLREQAAWIRQFPEVKFRVYGHADAVGRSSYNRSLGLRRARAVVNYLATQGIGRDRLEAMDTFGDTQPLVISNGPERRNRRTVTEVSGFVSGHPNVMDGKYAHIIYREYVASATQKSSWTFPGETASTPRGGGGSADGG